MGRRLRLVCKNLDRQKTTEKIFPLVDPSQMDRQTEDSESVIVYRLKSVGGLKNEISCTHARTNKHPYKRYVQKSCQKLFDYFQIVT